MLPRGRRAARRGLRRSPDLGGKNRWARLRLAGRRRRAAGTGAGSHHRRQVLLGALLQPALARHREALRLTRSGLGAAALDLQQWWASRGLLPTRYPGSEASSDPALRMARKTEWQEGADGSSAGVGQRMLTAIRCARAVRPDVAQARQHCRHIGMIGAGTSTGSSAPAQHQRLRLRVLTLVAKQRAHVLLD